MQSSKPASTDDMSRGALDNVEHTQAVFGRDSDTRTTVVAVGDGPTAPLLGASTQQATQGPSTATRMFGCLLQAGSAPFKLMWNYPRTTVALLAAAANAVGQSCMYGTPGFEGAPQQYCNDAAKAMMDNKMVVTGMAGTLFAMGAHMVTDAVSRFRANRAEAEADTTAAVRAAM